MPRYHLRVNGKSSAVDSWDPDQPLLYVLRNALGLRGAKFGCGLGQCGFCTVWMDGQAARSCITTVEQAAGHSITTLEGLGSVGTGRRTGEVFTEVRRTGALQAVLWRR